MAEVSEKFAFIFLYLKISTFVRIVCLKSGHLSNTPNKKTANYFNGGE